MEKKPVLIDQKYQELLNLVQPDILSKYDAVTARFILENKINGKTIPELLLKGNKNSAIESINNIYEKRKLQDQFDQAEFEQDVVDTIMAAVELLSEANQDVDYSATSHATSQEDSLDSVNQSKETETEAEASIEQAKVFDEKKYEDIIDDIYIKLGEPSKYADSIENDIVSYIKAEHFLDKGDDADFKIDFLDAYVELLTHHNSPDIRPAILYLLPQVKQDLDQKIDTLNQLIVKIRTGKETSLSGDDVLNSILYYQNIRDKVLDFENSQNNNEDIQEDFGDTNTVIIQLDNLGDDTNTTNEDPKGEQEPKSIEKEKTQHEKFEDYLFKKGIKQVVIHGGLVEYKKDSDKQALMPRVDFDADSALMVLDEVGAKYATGATSTWIHPEAVLKQDKSGRYYYEYNKEKTFLSKGAVVIDVGKSNGFNVLDGDIFTIDHHAIDADDDTSATQILVENLEKLNKYTDGTEKFPEYLKSYAKLVSKIDNLSMYTEMDIDGFKENYANTMYALQPFLYNKNKKILIEMFKKYPNISLDGFTKEELEYPIGVREYTSVNDHRSGFRGVKIYPEIPENFNLDYVYEDFTIADVVENQKRALEYSINEIDFQAQRMFKEGLKIDSPIMGRTIFIDQQTIEYVDKDDKIKEFNTYSNNSFGAVTAYKMGYDTMIIFNRDKGNQIFVSSKNKEGLQKFADNLKIYYDNAVIVRDKMLILRDRNLKDENPEYIKNAIIDSAQIDGFDKEQYMKEIDDYIKQLNKKT